MSAPSIAKRRSRNSWLLTILMAVICLAFLAPILIVLMNSFKGKLFISTAPFDFPSSEAGTFVGLANYTEGVRLTGFFQAFGYSLFITVFSVFFIVLLTAMTGWFLARVENKVTRAIYLLLVFSMVVPFQMVMFTIVETGQHTASGQPRGHHLRLRRLRGGAFHLHVHRLCPLCAARNRGSRLHRRLRPGAHVLFRGLPRTQAHGYHRGDPQRHVIWNDYLLPYLLLGSTYKTIPIAVQYLKGGYGSVDMGAMMAVLVLSIVPIVIFYLACQKYIIRGVIAGAVKG